MKKQQRASLALAAAGLGLLLGSHAQAEEGFYFGLGGGVTSVDLSRSGLDAMTTARFTSPNSMRVAGIGSTLDDSDKNWNIQLGYRFNSHLAVEIGYVDLGKALYDAQLTVEHLVLQGGVPVVAVTEAVRSDLRFLSAGPTAALVGMYALGNFDIHARAGLYFGDTRVRWRDFRTTVIESAETKSDSTDVLFGIGATWNINESYSVRLELQRYADVGDGDTTGEADVDLLTASILFR